MITNRTIEDYGLVSIIMPTYNSSDFIRETLDSILLQTYSNWELLITDDKSSDETVAIIEEYIEKDSRIKLFKQEQNGGAGVCRNRSIEAAVGRFIAFCDSDDCWFPYKLENQLYFMKKKNCAFSYTSYLTQNERSRIKGIVICSRKETLFSMLCNNGIGCLSVIYDTELLGKEYMPTLRKRQDWGLWLTLLKNCKVAYGMKEPLAYYRLRKGSISYNKRALIKFNVAVYREIMHFSWLKAHFFFFFLFLPKYFIVQFLNKCVNR